MKILQRYIGSNLLVAFAATLLILIGILCLANLLRIADLIVKGMEGAIAKKVVTYDFARLMDGAIEVKCSEFAGALIGYH